MNILQLSVSNSGFGGANRAAYRIHSAINSCDSSLDAISLLRVLHDFGHDKSVVGGDPARSFFQSVPVRRRLIRLVKSFFAASDSSFLSIGWPSTGLGSEIGRLYRSDSVDVIHFHALDNALLSIEELGSVASPIVWTLHDQWAFCGSEHYSDGSEPFVHGYCHLDHLQTNGDLALHRWVWRRKARAWTTPMQLVAPSRWMADCAQRSALMSHWPVRVIPNPIDLSTWAPFDPSQARHLLNLPQDVPLILFGATGGTADRRKGGDLLLQALEHLRSDGFSHTHLAVFGQSGPDPGFASPLPIHYLGSIADELHLRLLYAAADVFVIPSRQDNLPNTGLEAHACGTPVVAFRTCGLVDIVDHHVTGALADPFEPASLAQAIRWVLGDAARRQSIGDAARRRAEALWAPRRIAGLYIDLYREVMERQYLQ